MHDGLIDLYAELLQDGGVIIGVISTKGSQKFVTGRMYESYRWLQTFSLKDFSWESISNSYNSGDENIRQIVRHHTEYDSILVVKNDG